MTTLLRYEDSPVSVPEITLPPPATAAALIRSRRTIHEFQPEPPPRDTILQALELACRAPNHYVTEPWRFYLPGPQTVQAIARLNADLIERAKGPDAARSKLERWLAIPGWVVVTCENSDDPLRSREDYAACCCAIQNFALYLWSAGIGVKWTTGDVIREPAFYDLIWVDPALETVVGLLWYGYPAAIPQTARKLLGEVLVALP
jgi:nitroreductase